MRFIQSAAELYAHAIAIEREAAARYSEFAERMADQGREDLARLFALLARLEAEHLEALQRRTAGIAVPEIAQGEHKWLDAGAPETAAREFLYRLMTPRYAIAIALRAERHAQAFFEHVFWTSTDPSLRALAREMAADEREHAALLAAMLDGAPEPALDQTLIFSQ
jgi:rubrerythrin